MYVFVNKVGQYHNFGLIHACQTECIRLSNVDVLPVRGPGSSRVDGNTPVPPSSTAAAAPAVRRRERGPNNVENRCYFDRIIRIVAFEQFTSCSQLTC